jgi:sugar/nucleoside kinase (ribokinase family)
VIRPAAPIPIVATGLSCRDQDDRRARSRSSPANCHEQTAAGTNRVLVTRGIKVAQAWHREAGPVKVDAPNIDVVDTIEAGDSFQATLCCSRCAPSGGSRVERWHK